MPRKYKTKRKKSRSKPAKAVKLDGEFWLKNQKEVNKYKTSMLIDQEYRCGITKLPLEYSTSVLDHCHMSGVGSDGRVRGVLLSEVNCLEGRYLKLFKKAKLEEKYGLTFDQTLINMGTYLQKDNSKEPLHYKLMDDLRKHIKSLAKPEIISRLRKDLDVESDLSEKQRDLVHLYVQTWVDKLESKLK